MRDKIIQITNPRTTDLEPSTILYGLSESGKLYRMTHSNWNGIYEWKLVKTEDDVEEKDERN